MVLKKPASAGFLLSSQKRPVDFGASWTSTSDRFRRPKLTGSGCLWPINAGRVVP